MTQDIRPPVIDAGRAYETVKNRYGLRHTQRTTLDHSPLYMDILRSADKGDWDVCTVLLKCADVL